MATSPLAKFVDAIKPKQSRGTYMTGTSSERAHLSLAISESGSPPLRRRLRRQLAVADGRNSAAARSPCSCSAPASLPVSGCSAHGQPGLQPQLLAMAIYPAAGL